jgi:hypothetical protein
MNAWRALTTLGARRSTRRRVAWGGALLIAAIFAIAAFDIVRSWRVAVADSASELESQARIISEQTARSVQAIDIVLRHIDAEFHRGRLSQLSPDELHAYLREHATASPRARPARARCHGPWPGRRSAFRPAAF